MSESPQPQLPINPSTTETHPYSSTPVSAALSGILHSLPDP